ncbi:hypothetical protein FPQ18DRAFT_62728 [Pyronema domesticum]|uniref:GDS1 winged helix domain-containing protein n=1 Tax=Pyronema omphalodes (strain CBS 100304) TaxID=1076935 RepID=U4LGL4_PYROM|nr:hypothetical protein FPQ18DRAFT_62728 [Pyronema domesticum]CCX30672.1 Similar to hypothetical protein [Tuber melanosporum Mel28]; acc. no. XP_002837899 [Pyronema omphalodes CBS 100304]
MPYNTRRKSLSLPSLGIQLPSSSRSHQTPPASAKSEHQPTKKVKRDSFSQVTQSASNRYEPTPPPSPLPSGCEIDYASINDDVVARVVRQLEDTGNRPHSAKELAISLAPAINLESPSPSALITTRINNYLKRSNYAVIAKTQNTRRIYYYLTTQPHQSFPDNEHTMPRRSVVSPALTDEEEEECRRRIELSPSPEVDLSSHELDDGESTDTGSLVSAASSMIANASMRKNALVSPPLEGDEREFSQSALYIERRASRVHANQTPTKRTREEYEGAGSDEGTLDETADLLGYTTGLETPEKDEKEPKRVELEKAPQTTERTVRHAEFVDKPELCSWGGELGIHLGTPESIELDELDDLLDF